MYDLNGKLTQLHENDAMIFDISRSSITVLRDEKPLLFYPIGTFVENDVFISAQFPFNSNTIHTIISLLSLITNLSFVKVETSHSKIVYRFIMNRR